MGWFSSAKGNHDLPSWRFSKLIRPTHPVSTTFG
jgi:hypothetical protein